MNKLVVHCGHQKMAKKEGNAMKINSIIWVALFSVLLAVSLTSCGGGGGDSGTTGGGGGDSGTEEKAIKQLYTTWESSLENKNITAAMSCYSGKYLHDGETKSEEQSAYQVWFNESTNPQITITNLDITITGNSAETSFHVKIIDGGITIADEDWTDGGTNYLIKENGNWRFYGNRK